jgi:hypothetical protein
MTRTNRTERRKLPCHRVDGQNLSQLSRLRLQSRLIWLVLRDSPSYRLVGRRTHLVTDDSWILRLTPARSQNMHIAVE